MSGIGEMCGKAVSRAADICTDIRTAVMDMIGIFMLLCIMPLVLKK